MTKELFFIFIISFLVGIYFVFFFHKKKYLDKKLAFDLQKKLKHIEQDTLSNKEKFVVLDILFHQILKGIGYEGNFGEILKKNPKEIKNINEIWRLHKLRNTLVHELGNHEDKNLEKEVKKYVSEIRNFLLTTSR